MRPDEHKKTKNARYKKKHGIHDKVSDHVSQGVETSNKNVIEKKKQTKHLQPAEAKPENSPESSSFGFSKRQVKSNWERYEPINDDEVDQGSDFNVLLSFAGNASSHMKLKNEEEWDSQQGDFMFVNIDHDRLVESVTNVPFVEKYKLTDLGLDSNILEYISNMNDSELATKSDVSRKRILSSSLSSQLGFNFSRNNTTSTAENKPGVTENLLTEETQDLPSTMNERDSRDTFDKIDENNADETDNDLAAVTALLNTDSSSGANRIPCVDSKDGEKPEEQNFSLTSAEKASKITEELIAPDASRASEVSKDETSSNNAVDDLEDWLDSIL